MSEENKNLVKCEDCGIEFDTDSEGLTTHNGTHVCDTCSNNYSYCEDSEEYFPEDEIREAFKMNHQGRKITVYVHQDSSNYVETHDGEFWHTEDTYEAHNSRGRSITISREDYESGDYFTCDDCDEIYHVDYSNYMENLDRTVCHDCESSGYSYCSECESYSNNDDSCNCENHSSSNLINDYSFKPAPKFKGQNSKINPFMGIESEVESKSGNKNDQAEKCHEILEDNIYLKADGSLNNGFEIVSHPMTIQEHKKLSYETLFKELSSMGMKSHDTSTCGLHFHLDKRGMTDSHKVRFGAFFALSQNKLEILARRTSKQYAKFKNKGLKMDEYSSSDSRYEAVNWENDNTVEVRIFKGTLKFETFMASMELCHAIYCFTHSRHSFACKFEENVIWGRFTNFLKKNAASYSYLITYLESKSEKLQAAIKLDEIEAKQLKARRELDNQLNDETELSA